MKTKEIVIWFAVIVALVGGFWFLINAVNAPPSPSAPVEIKNLPPVSANDFIRGNPSAKVTLIEYADFQCPACATMHATIKKLQADFRNDLKLVYRFFPLINIHQNSLISTQAVYAAGLQGKFWEMSDLVYENQDSWSDNAQAKNIFVDYAKELGLDLNKFNSDINSDSTNKFVTDAENSALNLGINSTPTLFLNRKIIQDPTSYSYEDFKKLIQDEIKAQ